MANGKAGAPIGNKNGVGYGRPAKEGYSNEELIALGEELIKWTKQCDKSKKKIVHLSEWYSQVKEIPPRYWKCIIVRDCFKDYYERAKVWVGIKIMQNKELSPTYGSRFLGIYFEETAEYELDVAKKKIDYEIEKKREYEQRLSTPPNDDKINLQLELIKQREELESIRKENISLKETIASKR